MDDDLSAPERREIEREKRRRKHLARLGFPNPSCFYCGESDPRCLQLDHVSGREFDGQVWPLCANDHARRTDFQKDHPPKLADSADPLERAGRFLEGFADFLEMAEPKLRDVVELLRQAGGPWAAIGRVIAGFADAVAIMVTKFREVGPMIAAAAAARSPRVRRDQVGHDAGRHGRDGGRSTRAARHSSPELHSPGTPAT